MPPSYSTQSWPNGEWVEMVIPLSMIGLEAVVSESVFLFRGVMLAVESSPLS